MTESARSLVFARFMRASRGLDAREWNIILTQLGGIVSKAVSLASIFITIPWLLRYLGPSRLGLWMTLTSLTALLGSTDFGIGNGTLTLLARLTGTERSAEQRKLVTNSLAALAIVTLVLMTLLAAAAALVDWSLVFNTSKAEEGELTSAALTYLALTFLSTPFGLGQRILQALLRGAANAFWTCLGSVAGIAAIYAGITMQLSLPSLLGAYGGSQLLASLISTIYVIYLDLPHLRPTPADLCMKTTLEIGRSGLRYFLSFVVFSVTFASDNVFIAGTLGTTAVASYVVADRLYQLIAVLLSMLNAPLWPAYAEAMARQEWGWVRRRFTASIKLNLGIALFFGIVLVAATPVLLSIWVAPIAAPPIALSIAIAVRRAVEAVYSACAMLLNASHAAAFQLLSGAAMAVAAAALRPPLLHAIGLSGAPIAVILAVVVFSLLPFTYVVSRVAPQS